MQRWLIAKFCLITLLTINSLASAQPSEEQALETVYLHSRELSLPQFQLSQLSEDRPFAAALFDASGNLWVVGKSSVWKWAIGEKSLQRIKLSSASEPLVALEKSNGYLFAASDRHLFRIKFGPEEIIRFNHPAGGKGHSGRLISGSQSVWWMHSDGTAWLDEHDQIHSYAAVGGDLAQARHSWFDTENRMEWILNGPSLVKVDYRHTPPKQEEVHKARHPFADIHGEDGFIMVNTNHTIIRLDSSNTIKQIIPVEGDRMIIASDVSANVHSYFFNDRLLEIYDMARKIKFQSRLALTANENVTTLLTQGSLSVVIADGMPHVFTHERNLNISAKSQEKPLSKG